MPACFMTSTHREITVERLVGSAMATAPSMAQPACPACPDLVAQKAILEQLFDRKFVEGEYWYVLLAEWIEHLKKYIGISSTRKYYQKRVSSPPGPIMTRRDYAHTVDAVHEDAWRMLVQWYGLAEGHKPMKLVVYNYSRAAEIEHNLNSFKVMLTTSPLEDFHNVRFSKMEKVGHVESKIRDLYRIPKSHASRLWAKADVDSDWKPLFCRDKAIGKCLEIDSDFTRPICALEVNDGDGVWSHSPEHVEANYDFPVGPLYEHNLFEDVTCSWEVDIHEQIEQIGKSFLEKLHANFSGFVMRAREYVDDRENHVREREREMCDRETVTDRLNVRLQEKERHLNNEIVKVSSVSKFHYFIYNNHGPHL